MSIYFREIWGKEKWKKMKGGICLWLNFRHNSTAEKAVLETHLKGGGEEGGRRMRRGAGPGSQPPPAWEVREAGTHESENLKTDNVHAKRIILLQSGKDLVNCKVACVKTFFQSCFKTSQGGLIF